jgi:hypothetical protein
MPKELGRERHTAADVDWPDLPLPEAAAAQRRISAFFLTRPALRDD